MKKRRRLRNCISAQLHRERKRAYVESLEKTVAQLRERVAELEKENERLRETRQVPVLNHHQETTETTEGGDGGVMQSFEEFPCSLFDDIVAAADGEFEGDEIDFSTDALFEGIHSEAAVDVDGGNSRSKKRRRKQHTAGMFSIVSVAVLCLIGILHGGTGSIISLVVVVVKAWMH